MRSATFESHAEAVRLLRGGGVVILPTDTVYGIAAHPGCEAAVARICTIKGRPTGKPIALLAADLAAVLAFGASLPPAARRLAEAFWPGALTLVLPCGAGEEGFRVPDHAAARALLAGCGGTLRVTSANLSGAMPAVSAVEALRDVGLEADLVIDGGVCPGGVASSVVRVAPDGTLAVLREGAISSDSILRASKF
ncbi:MAG: threonylcarbamoyl-AMP synthase [Verrucomicrobiota bacterium]|jgi:L-threonylcarbamoyladenylate synthase|nr:threonylcarbamoyl-AMP synthase [Verrucomicrobiota bacterium]